MQRVKIDLYILVMNLKSFGGTLSTVMAKNTFLK